MSVLATERTQKMDMVRFEGQIQMGQGKKRVCVLVRVHVCATQEGLVSIFWVFEFLSYKHFLMPYTPRTA